MKPKRTLRLAAAFALLASSASAQFFTSTDLGGPTYPGSAVTNADNTLTISGGGGDIWGNSDQCQYFYSWASGQQWDATVQITGLSGPDWWTKAELMVRWSDLVAGPQANDPFIAAMTTQAPAGAYQNEVNDQFRSTRGGGANSFGLSPTWQPTFPNQWLRLNRNNSVFTVAFGSDGVHWTNYVVIDTASTAPVAGSTFGVAWPDAVTVGLAVTAHNNGSATLGVATFSDLKVTFPPIQSPTAIGVTAQVTNAANYAGSEVSFNFVTTNNAQPAVVNWPTYVNYQWYKNGTAIARATSTSYTHLINPQDPTEAGAYYYCQATVLPPFNGTVTGLTSATGTVSVAPGALYYTNGLKMELFAGGTRGQVEDGNVPAGVVSFKPNLDLADDTLSDYGRRLSGWFIAPVTTNYVFFLAADDDTDIFLSTDSNPANKRLIAQETGWSPYRAYTNSTGSNLPQKRSDQWTNDLGVAPFANGIPLTAGQLYYLEAVHHEGAPTDNLSLTYAYWDINNADLLTMGPTNGTPSLLQGTNNNLVLITSPTTNLNWAVSPTNTTVTEGHSGAFYANAVSNTEMLPLYQWYRNGNAVSGATASSLTTSLLTPADNGTTVFVVANTAEGGLSITSAVATLTVDSPILERGWVNIEFWQGKDRPTVEAGNAGVPTYTITSPGFEAGLNGSSGNGYARRLSGFFIPPATDDYVFFVNSDDDADLFLSTDSTLANKRLIAQGVGYSESALTWLIEHFWDGTQTVNDPWLIAQTRSDQWTNSAGLTPYAAGIRLAAGQKYYLEAVQHDGSGGNYFSATFKRLHTLDTGIADADPISGQDSRMRGNVIAMNATRCTSVTITQVPVNVTVAPGLLGSVSFSTGATTDSKTSVGNTGDPRPLVASPVYAIYQWQKNGADIPGATASTYSYSGPILPSDNGSVFTCKVRALGFADNSLNPIWITNAPQTLTVTPQTQFVLESGLVMIQHWAGKLSADIESGNVGNPDWVSTSPEFEVSTNNESGDSYSRRIAGFFIPPATDDYVFWVTSDDNADLFLSTDASPMNKRLIARDNDWANAFMWNTGAGLVVNKRSDRFSDWATGLNNGYAGIHLVAGRQYYLEVIHHEGTGGDNVEVMYSTMTGSPPFDGEDTQLKGTAIGFLAPPSHVEITNQPAVGTLPNYAPLSLTVGAGTDSKISFGQPGDIRNSLNALIKYQWYRNGTPIAGATTSIYSQSAVLPTDAGAQFFCAIRSIGLGDATGAAVWSNSAPVTLTIVTNAPHLLYSAFYTNANWIPFTGLPITYVTLVFDSPMDPVLLSQMSTYTLGGGLTIVGVNVSSNDYRSVALEVTGIPTFPLSVTINSAVAGLGGGLRVANTTLPVKLPPLTSADIGSAGIDPAVPGMLFMDGSNAYTIQCEGSDIWGNADGFNFAYEMKTNDFDVVVRQKDITHTSNWAKGGLMVRETLDSTSRNWNIINDPVSSDGIAAPDGSGYGANVIECNSRPGIGQATGGWDFNRGAAPAYPNAWVRLTRKGGLLSAYHSTDGMTWTLAATNDPVLVGDLTPLPAIVYVGLCTTAHNNDPLGTPMDSLRFLNIVDYADYNSSYVPPATLTAVTVGNSIRISWTPNVGRLMQSPAVAGPTVDWQPVPGGTGGLVTLPISGTSMFFRIVNP